MSDPKILHERIISGKKRYVELAGVSTDTKPEDNICTGSIMTEVDTGKVYFFNEGGSSGEKWVEQFTFQQE